MRKSFIFALVTVLALTLTSVSVAYADTTPQALPLNQDWSDTNLITTNDDWSRVPGIIGYEGRTLVSTEGVNPQTITADASTETPRVTANKTNPSAANFGGITEFHKTGQQGPKGDDPTVAFAANVTADAPHLVLAFDTTGQDNVNISYTLRDIDGGTNDAVQPVAMQYRVGNTGPYTNVPAGYVADATTGPNLAVLDTQVSAALPADAANKSLVQVRVISTNSPGQDEWIGLDLFQVASATPAIDLNGSGAGTGYDATFTEDSGPTSIVDDAALTVNDGDSANLDSATVTLTNRQDGTDESLSADTSGTPITASYDPSTGVLTLNGSATLAQYQQVLRSIKYDNTSNTPGTTARTVNFVVNDGTYNSNIATSTIAITASNDAPTASNDSASVDEDGSTTVNVLANDSDVDGTLDVTLVKVTGAPQHGTTTVNSNGTIKYTPNANFNGSDSFTYEVCDNGEPALCDTATVSITVDPVNDAPKANADDANVDEDNSVDITVLGNDTDTDGNNTLDPASVKVVSAPQHGTATANANGTITYTPSADFYGEDSFTYEVCDNDSPALCDTATVSVTVAAVNDVPVARDDSLSTPEDTLLTIQQSELLENDSTGAANENQTLTIIDVSNPVNGTVKLNDDGTITFTPEKNYHGSEASFDYTVSDGQGNTSTATANVRVTVTSVNDAPVAANDIANVNEDGSTTVNVLDNDSDEDGQDDLNLASVKVVTAPSHGTAVAHESGTITYTPKANYNGSDSFTYEVCDRGTPSLCDTATVSVSVSATNDAPVANDDAADVDEDGSTTIDVLDNDTDIDENDVLDVSSVSVKTQPEHGTATVNPNGTITYTPSADFYGNDSFTYEVCDDGEPVLCDTVMVSVTVKPVNDAPVANDDTVSTEEDTPLTIHPSKLLANDNSGAANENQTLTITAVSNAVHGTVVLNNDGTITFTPAANYHGSEASFDYTISDGQGNNSTATAKVKVTVTPVNDAPVANDDVTNVSEDGSKVINVLANDADADGFADLDPSSVKLVSVPQHGTATVNPNGTITYTPAADYHGSDSFTYEVCDKGTPVLCDTATVSVKVNAVNDDPVAKNDAFPATTASQNLALNVLANDSDVDGDALSITHVTQPPADQGSVAIDNDRRLLFTANPSFVGTTTFTYTISDGNGGTATATVTMTITRANTAPVVRDDKGSTAVAAAVSNSFISQYANSLSTTPTSLYRLNTSTSPYTFDKIGKDVRRPMNAIGYRSTDNSLYGYRTANSPGIMQVNPTTGAADFLGNPTGLPASKSYIAGDVSPNGSTYYLYGSKSGLLRRVDLKTFQTSTVKLSSAIAVTDLAASPADGNLYGVDKDGKLLRINPKTGEVTTRSVPNLLPGGYGAAWFTAQGDLIVYENGTTKPVGTLTWITNPTTTPRVASTQDGPSTVGNDGAAYTGTPNWANLSVEIDVLANDSDPEDALDPSTLRIVEQPLRGTARINADNTITYTSSSSYRGTDSFRYEVCDNGTPRLCGTATVNITSAPITSSTSPAASRKE